MKTTVFSFPFFVCFCLLCSSSIFSQNTPRDSLDYYAAIAETPKSENDLQNAYHFFLRYQEQSQENKDMNAVIYSYLLLSNIEFKVGLYNESEGSAVKALGMMDSLAPVAYFESLKPTIYNHIARLYQELKNYSNAKKYYNTSLPFAKSAIDSLIIYNNLGNIYLEEGNYKASKRYLTAAGALEPKVPDSINRARVWANLGFVEHKLNYGEGLDLLNKALKTRKRASDLVGIYDSYKLLSEYYSDIDEQELSASYADSAYSIAKEVKSLTFKEDALRLLSAHDTSYIKKYFQISDSLKRITNESQNKFIYLKYNFDKATKESLQNKLNTEKEKTKSLVLFFVIALLLVSGTGYILWLRGKNKKVRILDIYNTETRISKRVHDEVANDIYHVMSKIQAHSHPEEELLDDLENLYNKTRDISKDNSAIELEVDFNPFLMDMISNYKTEKLNVIVKDVSKMEWDKISDFKKVTLYRILQELMINMKKHSQASLVVLRFEQQGSRVTVYYTDNGQGCNTSELRKGGLANAENRIQAINGTFNFESEINKGFKAIITV
ncbi:MAG: tetratricopeptide repeat protein [Mangrovimonas sp.]|nr:tetratricopeptide repeat protein [Mangrovimonas sp.]MCB0437973.1 tetratricopeptide repeat protein [Mangrovimonas sp.]